MTQNKPLYQPGISVIIPTEGRINLTKKLLSTLIPAREKFSFPTEVLVIDSSTGQDLRAITDACKECNADLIPGSHNVRQKRNTGLASASYSLILFLDSDCRPEPNLLIQHWNSYCWSQDIQVGGVLGQVVFEGPKRWTWYMIRNSSLIERFSTAGNKLTVSWGPTANLSIRHDVLDKIGNFDTHFPFRLGGDDLDLTHRMVQNGYPLICNSLAIVFHSRETWSSFQSILRRAFRWGRMEFHLSRKHPDGQVLTPPPFWGWFLLVGILLIFQTIIFRLPYLLFGLLGWMTISLLIYSFFDIKEQNESHRNRMRSYAESLLTSVPELTYQLGTAWESIQHRRLSFLWTRVQFDTDAVQRNWLPEAWNLWSNICALLLIQLIVFLYV